MSDTINKYTANKKENKSCINCEFYTYWGDILNCNYGLKEFLQDNIILECHNFDKWKMKSN